jgi:hypothetical protein
VVAHGSPGIVVQQAGGLRGMVATIDAEDSYLTRSTTTIMLRAVQYAAELSIALWLACCELTL